MTWPERYPVAHRQLVLFDAERDYTAGRGAGLTPPLPDLVDAFAQVTAELARQHGWRKTMEASARSTIHTLLAVQDTPGAPIKASDAAAVTVGRSLRNLRSVLEVLADAGMLEEDRQSSLNAYFARLSAGLATPMAEEFRHWFHAMRDGSTTRPRGRPRGHQTIRPQLAYAAPALRAWTAMGFQSLREIERQHVVDVLPTRADRSNRTLTALRSLFRFLKARRMVFINPTARLRGTPITPSQPLPLDLEPLRDAVNSAKPARAALATLVAFHALSVEEIRTLKLTEVRDGRIHLDRRTILLAAPVRETLANWLDERARRWPRTINPHLFVNQHTAVRLCRTSDYWITKTIGISAQAIRQDRILHEAVATGGDVRRLCDLFGLSIGGAERYAHTDDQPAVPAGSGTDIHSEPHSAPPSFSSSRSGLQKS